jgi:pyruvate dehydrogenase E1 component
MESLSMHKTEEDDIRILNSIQKRVLWLATYLIHYANSIRENPDGTKVGGHQASSASMVSIMTALYFHALRYGDRVSIKPHASPVYHAIQALLGRLPLEKLKEFRSFKGLQAYPSRTKDPDGVDFSTGSVGLGAVSPNFGALTQEFIYDHFGVGTKGHYISIVGDAELDEGNVWEALGEEALAQLGNVLWIIDLNRQSLDRVIPSGSAQKLERMFQINGWHLIELKYGSKLDIVYAKPNGSKLRERIDLMTNDEYQSLLLLDGETIRSKLPSSAGLPMDKDIFDLLRPYSAQEVKELLSDLGGHDLKKLIRAFDEADRIKNKLVVIFAYTIKGWGLPFAGDPLNHSLHLTESQIKTFQEEIGIQEGHEFSGFSMESEEYQYIQKYLQQLELQKKAFVHSVATETVPSIPDTLNETYKGRLSTQQALGTILTSLSRIPEIASRIVTTSPDVAISTNLGGWVNKMGVYSSEEMMNYFTKNEVRRLLNWEQSPKGHHIELGISENNFFLLLNMLGLSKEFTGEVLFPIGTIYDPFVCRGLDSFIYAAYSESKFIFAGTPSGVSLNPEGGAHQSTITPSIGIEMPNVVYYDPAFAQELEWILLHGMKSVSDRNKGKILYLRLSTKPVQQDLFPYERLNDKEETRILRENVIKGGYRLIDYSQEPDYEPGFNVANIFTTGVMIPECVQASQELRESDIYANVINITSPGLLYQGYHQAHKMRMKNPQRRITFHLEKLIPHEERQVPVVTVIDGHSHALSFIGGIFGARMITLGVDEFGQSGTRNELYDHYDIGASAIRQAVEYSLD